MIFEFGNDPVFFLDLSFKDHDAFGHAFIIDHELADMLGHFTSNEHLFGLPWLAKVGVGLVLLQVASLHTACYLIIYISVDSCIHSQGISDLEYGIK
jgi:hypothetical protein